MFFPSFLECPTKNGASFNAVGNYNDNYGVEDYELTPEGYVIIPITTVEKGKQKNIVVLSDGKLINPSVEKIVYIHANDSEEDSLILGSIVLGEKDGNYQNAKNLVEKMFGSGVLHEVFGQDNRYYGEPNMERERRDSRSTIRFSKELQEQGRNGSGFNQGEFADERRSLEDIDDLLDDDMFESLFNDGFIDELEDELDDQKYVSKKYTGWLEELMDSLEESIKAADLNDPPKMVHRST